MSGTPTAIWLSQAEIDPKLYYAWRNMKNRCRPTYTQHADYHDRGIKVCDDWIRSFTTFASDMGPHPGAGWTLDRKDNNLGYSKHNCRWATRSRQSRNRRVNRTNEEGVCKIRTLHEEGWRVCDIARKLNLPYHVVSYITRDVTWRPTT